ncbi:phage neck terminator protein [Lactobacillus helveticus]|uniref:phage neck terminator protein n=1 Tax=Lactobacillus helveticus TaxID=1587 RepID=UPI00062A8D5D|nr:hypothetical protein [Lactobacillus helveticus]
MVDKLPAKLQDHFLVQYILGKLVNQVTNCELVTDSNLDEMENYPFFTFHWIDLGEETTSDWLGQHRQFTCTMQVDAHATSDIEAINLAQRLYEALHEAPYRRFFKQAYIVPQTVSNTANRTTLQGVNYDNDYGFDCSFYVTGGFLFEEKDLNFTFQDQTIETVKADESVLGTNFKDAIFADKNNKEKN